LTIDSRFIEVTEHTENLFKTPMLLSGTGISKSSLCVLRASAANVRDRHFLQINLFTAEVAL